MSYADFIGHTIGSYRVEALIGAGSLGRVYRGQQLALRRPVAIKVIHPHLSGVPEFQARFLSELRAAAGLRHPHIAPVLDFGEEDGRAFVVSDLVPDGALRALLQSQPGGLDARVVVDLLRQAALGLEHAHRQGVTHGDVSPGNLLLERRHDAAGEAGQEYTVRLGDFGQAWMKSAEPLPGLVRMTGAPIYEPPEVTGGQPLDPRGDLYALGVVAYEAISGARPRQGQTPIPATPDGGFLAPPLRDARPDLPDGLEDVIQRCLARSPEERFPSAAALIAALDAVERDAGWRAGESGQTPILTPSMVPWPIAGPATAVDLTDSGYPEPGDRPATPPSAATPPPDRPADEPDSLSMFFPAVPVDALATPPPEVPATPIAVGPLEPPPPSKRRAPVWALAAIAVAILFGAAALAGLFLLDGDDDGSQGGSNGTATSGVPSPSPGGTDVAVVIAPTDTPTQEPAATATAPAATEAGGQTTATPEPSPTPRPRCRYQGPQYNGYLCEFDGRFYVTVTGCDALSTEVDWGDGTTESGGALPTGERIEHQYTEPGLYYVKMDAQYDASTCSLPFATSQFVFEYPG
jgi:serine/threonine protein kinase